MKTNSYLLFLILLTNPVFAGIPDSLSNAVFNHSVNSVHPYFSLLYDANFTERAGTEDLLTLHYAWTRLEDILLRTQWFAEDMPSEKAAGVILRSAKTAFLDLPIDAFTFVFAHEYFGHGMRLREFSNIQTKYHLIMPVYQSGDGWAYTVASIPLSYQQFATIQAGGIEEQVLLNREITMDWLASNELYYRDAELYLMSFLNYYISTIHAPGNGANNTILDDPSGYLLTLNTQAGFTGFNKPTMTPQAFHSRMALSIANPFVFYSLYSFFSSYLWQGEPVSEFPVLHFGKVQYLPALRSGMSPFGVAYHFDNYLRYGNNVSRISLTVGDGAFYPSWTGFDVSCRNIATSGRWSADINLALWNQPQLMLTGDQITWDRSNSVLVGIPGQLTGGGFGGALSARGYYRLTHSDYSLAATAELGYKTIGFLEGYQLEASPILLVGLAFQPK